MRSLGALGGLVWGVHVVLCACMFLCAPFLVRLGCVGWSCVGCTCCSVCVHVPMRTFSCAFGVRWVVLCWVHMLFCVRACSYVHLF